MHPEDPLERATNRSWIEFGGGMLSDTFRLMTVATEDEFQSTIENLSKSLSRVDAVLDEQGPFFNGSKFSLVDAAYATLFVRLGILSELVALDVTSQWPKIDRWGKAMLAEPSVQAVITPILKTRFRELMQEKKSWTAAKLA